MARGRHGARRARRLPVALADPAAAPHPPRRHLRSALGAAALREGPGRAHPAQRADLPEERPRARGAGADRDRAPGRRGAHRQEPVLRVPPRSTRPDPTPAGHVAPGSRHRKGAPDPAGGQPVRVHPAHGSQPRSGPKAHGLGSGAARLPSRRHRCLPGRRPRAGPAPGARGRALRRGCVVLPGRRPAAPGRAAQPRPAFARFSRITRSTSTAGPGTARSGPRGACLAS